MDWGTIALLAGLIAPVGVAARWAPGGATVLTLIGVLGIFWLSSQFQWQVAFAVWMVMWLVALIGALVQSRRDRLAAEAEARAAQLAATQRQNQLLEEIARRERP